MRFSTVTGFSARLHLRPLAIALAVSLALEAPALLAMPAPTRPSAVETVSNCNDAGSGSLRDAVDNAADGDTIDLTQLSCSTISLSTGAILIGVSDLTLQGPGNHQLMIQGSGGSGGGALFHLCGGPPPAHRLAPPFRGEDPPAHPAPRGRPHSARRISC